MTRVIREKWTESICKKLQKKKKNNRLKRPGIEEDRQTGPRMTARRGEEKESKAIKDDKLNHKETKKNWFLVDQRHCGGI